MVKKFKNLNPFTDVILRFQSTCHHCFSGGNIIAVGDDRALLTSMRSRYPFYNIRGYILYGHGGNIVRAWAGHRSILPVTVTRKGKGAIFRSYRTVMESIPYEHRGNSVRTQRQYRTSIEAILYDHRGNIVRAWTGHRSVPPVTGTNIRSCVRTILCLYDIFVMIIFKEPYLPGILASVRLRLPKHYNW